MLSTDSPRDVFGQENSNGEQLAEFKTKLQWAVNHLSNQENMKKNAIAHYGWRIKWFKRMIKALNDAIRTKSTLPLIQEFGEENWERDLKEVQALYHKFSEDDT